MPKQNNYIIELTLSILLAAAVAHTLNTLAIYIPEEQAPQWIFSSVVILLSTIGIVAYVLNITFKDKITLLKTALIFFFTMFLFSLSRFFYFLSQGIRTTNKLSYNTSLLFLSACGIMLIMQGCLEKKNRALFIILGALAIIISIIFYFLIEPLGIGRV